MIHSFQDLVPYRSDIYRIAEKYGVSNIRVFGSVARGEADKNSDIDFLVELKKGYNLLDLSGFLVEIEELFNCEVEATTEKGLHWYIKDRILEEAIPL